MRTLRSESFSLKSQLNNRLSGRGSNGRRIHRGQAGAQGSKCNYSYGANDYSALVPSLWAMETLKVMSEKMVASYLVHRDFENEIRAYGETVNTRKPVAMTAKRKLPTGSVVAQDATATNIQVVLNQHAYTTFTIDDVSISKSFLDIAPMFAETAALSLVQQVDRTITGQYAQFLGNNYGGLGQMTVSNTPDYLIGIREKAETLLWPDAPRSLLLGSRAESKILGTTLFNQANTSSNGGVTQKNGMMGSRFGWDLYGCQNVPNFTNTIPTSAGAINNASGYAAGSTTFVVDGITGAIGINTWFTVAGDYTPQRVVSHTETTGDTTGIVSSPGLQQAVVNDAVITFITPGQINFAAGYAAGWVEPIVYDTTSSAQPKVGQLVSFGIVSTSTYYTVTQINSSTSFSLDRPLVAAIVDDAKINFGPGGGFNLALHRNALSFVNRPLALPMQGAGAAAAVREFDNISVRVTIAYNAVTQAHQVTIDMLYGIAVLDSTLGAVLYS